mgnify:CR=1 FL=1
MDIDKKIKKLNLKSITLKLQINSYYYNNTSKQFIDILVKERINIRNEINDLKLLKIRNEKILKIKNNIKNESN